MELTRCRRWTEHARHRECSAAGNGGLDVQSTRRRDGPRDIGDAGANGRHLVSRPLLTPRVAHAGRALQLELADPNLLVLDREIGELRRQLGNLGNRITLAGPHQDQVLELARQVGPDPSPRIDRDQQGRAHASSIEHDRSVGRQVEARERQIQSLDHRLGLEVNRVESKLLDLDEVRSARGHRAGDDGPVVAQGRDVVRLDLNVVRRPRPPFGQRAVLECDRPINQREAIDGDIEPLLGRFRAFDQIGEVEILPESYDAKDRLSEDELAHPDMAAQRREQIQASLEALEVGERSAAARLGDVKPVDREAAAQQLNVDTIDADRSLGDRLQLRDRHVTCDGRQRVERRGDHDHDQQDARDDDERATRLDVHRCTSLISVCRRFGLAVYGGIKNKCSSGSRIFPDGAFGTTPER